MTSGYLLGPGQIQKDNLGMIELQHPLPYISGIKKTCQENTGILGHSDHALGPLVSQNRTIGKKMNEPINQQKAS